MRAVILAGGLGTRLAPFTTVFPKPLVPIGEVPILEIVLRQLRWHGIGEVVISVGYLAELIQAYFAHRPVPGLAIRYLREEQPLGTAGAIGLLEEPTDDFFVMNGDILTTLDFGAMLAHHRRHRPALTIATHRREIRVDLGVLETAADGSVTGYREKPTLHYSCSMGVYLYSPTAYHAIERGERLDFPDLVLRLLAQGEPVHTFSSDCYWQDIGRRDDYERAVEDFQRLRATFLPDEAAP